MFRHLYKKKFQYMDSIIYRKPIMKVILQKILLNKKNEKISQNQHMQM